MHKLDYTNVIKHFLDSEFDVQPVCYASLDALLVSVDINGRVVSLLHFCVNEILHLPQFFLKDYTSYGVLAHVLPFEGVEELGSICVNQMDSVSVNFERPELAFEESIRRHVKLLEKLITDTEFNQNELLREFRTNWYANTKCLRLKSPKTLYCTVESTDYMRLDLFRPLSPDSVMSITASFVAQPASVNDDNVSRFFQIDKRKAHQDASGCIIPLQSVTPEIPRDAAGLKTWLLNNLKLLPSELKTKLEREFYPHRAKEFWIVLNVLTSSGKAWVGVLLRRDKKREFPNNLEKIEQWKIEPFFVEVFNKKLMLPRSGANPTLDRKKIILFGCGSVGSEIAHKLGSSGVGHIDIADPDKFTTSNLYRHTLERHYTDWPKSYAVALQLKARFPWVSVNSWTTSLLENRNAELLRGYDLIIIAIGSPTHERLFHEFLTKENIHVPVVYTWLEGYGIGGHAILDIPSSKGCLRCAYVEPSTGTRGLASNLNFLASDQNVVKNYAGCGEMFIPYGAISSAQTALIAANLSVNFLEGKVSESKKVSWKGNSADSESEGLRVTPRYKHFKSSLKSLSLRHPLCDVCYREEPISYICKDGKRLYISTELNQELCSFRQITSESVESAGLLIGCYLQNGDVLVDKITIPKPSDIRTRTSFRLDAKLHQIEVDSAYEESDHLLGYIGTWHTHPQAKPVPSNIDKTDWREHEIENPDRPLFFIVVGLQKVSVYTLNEGNISELKLEIND